MSKPIFRKRGIEDVVFAFTEEFIKGRNPRISRYLKDFKGDKEKLQGLLIAAKIAYIAAHPHLDIPGDEESLQRLLKGLNKRRPRP